MSKKVSIYSARDEMQAEFLVQVLASHGIEAEMVGSGLTTLAIYAPDALRVHVNEQDVERARAVVAEFERAARTPAAAASNPADSWACANCGEIIEPQFTECWNCQSPRGAPADAAGAQPAPSSRVPPDPHIGADLACVECGYNLRNLPVDRVCPECAHPALASLLQAMQSQQDWSLDNEQALGPCLDYVERECGFPIEAITYTLQMWPRAVARASAAIGIAAVDVTPSDDHIALALRDVAIQFFGDPLTAARAMQRWHLASGADVRRLRAELARFGLGEG